MKFGFGLFFIASIITGCSWPVVLEGRIYEVHVKDKRIEITVFSEEETLDFAKKNANGKKVYILTELPKRFRK